MKYILEANGFSMTITEWFDRMPAMKCSRARLTKVAKEMNTRRDWAYRTFVSCLPSWETPLAPGFIMKQIAPNTFEILERSFKVKDPIPNSKLKFSTERVYRHAAFLIDPFGNVYNETEGMRLLVDWYAAHSGEPNSNPWFRAEDYAPLNRVASKIVFAGKEVSE